MIFRSFPRKRESRARSEERTGSPLEFIPDRIGDGDERQGDAAPRIRHRPLTVQGSVDKAKPPTLCLARLPDAQVAELVDALVSGTSGESRGGSSPLLGTISSNGG